MLATVLSFILSAAIMPSNIAPCESNDSIDNAVENTTPAYPIVRSLSDNESINSKFKTLKHGEAKKEIEKLITQAKRKKESTESIEKQLEICSNIENGLRGTDHVIIIDSTVVDKSDFLSVYPLSDELGKLKMSDNGEIVQYQAQLNGMVLTPKLIDTEEEGRKIKIVRQFLDDSTDKGSVIDGLSVDGDINYPYLLPDGQRFYFAARSSNGYGNYDLYATRYDSDSKRFYRAENMGYPHNSYANDYMLVIDEENNLGWFASDRYQPKDKVCVYTFIPNKSRKTLDADENTPAQLRMAASLYPLSALINSYAPEEQVMISAAIQRSLLMKNKKAKSANRDFQFVINNASTYYSLEDFHSAEAKKMCSDWLQKSKNLETLKRQLSEQRTNAKLDKAKVKNLEDRVMQLKDEVNALAKSIRKAEIEKLGQ